MLGIQGHELTARVHAGVGATRIAHRLDVWVEGAHARKQRVEDRALLGLRREPREPRAVVGHGQENRASERSVTHRPHRRRRRPCPGRRRWWRSRPRRRSPRRPSRLSHPEQSRWQGPPRPSRRGRLARCRVRRRSSRRRKEWACSARRRIDRSRILDPSGSGRRSARRTFLGRRPRSRNRSSSGNLRRFLDRRRRCTQEPWRTHQARRARRMLRRRGRSTCGGIIPQLSLCGELPVEDRRRSIARDHI